MYSQLQDFDMDTALQAQIGFTPIKEGVPQVPGASPSQLLQALQSHAGPHGRHLGPSSAYSSDVA